MRCVLRLFAFSLSLACLVARATADTISTFTLHSSLEYGTAAGSLMIDTTTGVLDSASVTASYQGRSEILNSVVSSTGSRGLYAIQLTTPSSGSGDDFYLDLPISTLIHYTGGLLGSSSHHPAQESSLYAHNTTDDATSGTLDLLSAPEAMIDTAETPEVASWVLTLTGTASLLVVTRRRREIAAEAAAGSAA